MDKRDYADQFAAILRAHEPCTDYDGCQCQHVTGREAGPSGYQAWVVHVVAQFLYPELAGPPNRTAPAEEWRAFLRTQPGVALDLAYASRADMIEWYEDAHGLRRMDPLESAAGYVPYRRHPRRTVTAGPDVTEDTDQSLTADKVQLSEVRTDDPGTEADTRPVGDSVTDPVVPHIIVRPGDIWRIEMAAMLAADGFTQSTGDIGDGFNPPGWVWEFTSDGEYDGRTLTIVVDPASLIIQNMEINGTPVPMISLTLPHTKPGPFDDDAVYAQALRSALERVAATGARTVDGPLFDQADRFPGFCQPVTTPPAFGKAPRVDISHAFASGTAGTRCQCGQTVIGTDGRQIDPAPSITCPRCGRTSWNPNDVREKWCGNCSDYHPGHTPGWLATDPEISVAPDDPPGGD